MNTRTTLLKAAVGLGLISMAHADTVYVAGSTAFRSAFHDAVFSLMTAGSGTCTATYQGSDFRSAAKAVFTGSIGGVPTTIKVAWSGSVGGISGLVNPASTVNTFLPAASVSAVTRSGTYPNYTYSGGVSGNTETAVAHAADLGMSDVFQNSTTFTSPALSYDANLAVVPFIFVASDNSDTAGVSGTGFDNITPLQAQLLWGSGRVSLSLFTGNPADNKPSLPTVNPGKEVFAFGRNNDSGTRLCMLAEMGKGALSGVIQYSYDTTLNTFTNTGNLGTAAATQAAWLADDDFSGTVGYAIGMLGTSDANTAVAGGAIRLKWNGVPYSDDNVRSGKYTVWGYEHLFAKNGASQPILDVADALANEMIDNPGTAGIELDTMNVQRSSEGGLIDLND